TDSRVGRLRLGRVRFGDAPRGRLVRRDVRARTFRRTRVPHPRGAAPFLDARASRRGAAWVRDAATASGPFRFSYCRIGPGAALPRLPLINAGQKRAQKRERVLVAQIFTSSNRL